MVRKKGEKQVTFICSECGKPVEGDHVVIRTRRHTELHIHYGCMRIGGKRNDRSIPKDL